MSPAIIVWLFGLSCPAPCLATPSELALLEKDVAGILEKKGFLVQPAPAAAERPTGETAPPEGVDVARTFEVDRVVVLDLEPKGAVLWITQFVQGVARPWNVARVNCRRGEGGVLACPALERALLEGMRPRTAEDVDLVALLRGRASAVSACVQAEDKVPAAERIFGRIEMDLEAIPTGAVRVVSIAPARVAQATLGQCLRASMESMDVGRFEGQPIRLRVPLDL